MDINVNLVEKLIRTQFPKWSNLEIKPVKHGGNDNRTFHLGKDMAVRLPSDKRYEPQVKKEAKFLKILASKLSIPITVPIEIGEPTTEYPFVWSINKWIQGETVSENNVDMKIFAKDLAYFLKELESIDSSIGPISGEHNFYRGGDLSVYHNETVNALESLPQTLDKDKCLSIWNKALSTKWEDSPVWIHGDMAPGNLISENDKLSGVIDFGIMGVGDPACDLVMAWTFFDEQSRQIFIDSMKMDEDTWDRARGWALWKALITYENKESKKVIKLLLDEN